MLEIPTHIGVGPVLFEVAFWFCVIYRHRMLRNRSKRRLEFYLG